MTNLLYKRQGNVVHEDVTGHVSMLNFFISLVPCLFRTGYECQIVTI